MISQNSFRFRLGSFECLAVLDTVDPMQLTDFFPNIPTADIQNLADQYRIPLASRFEITSLVVKTGRNTVLMDTGFQTGLRPNAGMLIPNLQAAGVSCRDIDTVILSHGHPDHIGGNVDSRLQPNFPSARHVINKKEWDFWASGPELKQFNDGMRQEMLECVRKNLLTLKDRVSVANSGMDIIPGFQYIDAPGHTPGQAALLVSSGTEQLIFVADIFHNVLQLARPDWSSSLDLDPEQAAETRKQILHRAVSTNALIFASHFPFPAIGRIVKEDDVHLWQPL
ncbi:MAG: MBL fold metallo-hydrolase [Dehalococcoidales bacterium]|nr:MBL fold metallo-hydrolase [Dehalococcoidales bacterium]